MKNVLILGANGMVGRDFKTLLKKFMGDGVCVSATNPAA